MLRWEEEYKEKLVTAAEAAGMVRSGDRIMTGNRDCRAVLNELLKRRDLEDVYYYAPIINYMPDTGAVGKWFRPSTSFLNDSSWKLNGEGRLDFIPGEYWLYDKIATVDLGCRIVFIEVTKPDEHGYMSLGTCADFIREACGRADLVIAETNANFPFIYGSNIIHESEIDYIVDEDADNYFLLGSGLPEDDEHTEIYKTIGSYLSELVPDEATIEVGLGRLNASALMYMEDKHNLGVHTEVYGDILMYLTEKGYVDNSRKSEHRGRSVFTQVVGTKELFRWMDHNQGLMLMNCMDILNPGAIYRQHRMTAINNAVEVDLLGQANAEYLKGKQYSGMGGICDFALGASACPDGKSIVVLESVTRNGKYSKITPCFARGVPVSLPRTAVEYVVTEYGIAKLSGKTPGQRTEALIAIAHPAFREELTYKARELGLC